MILFCCEAESCIHMFFDCFIVVWSLEDYQLPYITGIDAHITYENVARWWVSNNRNQANNLVHAATLWAIWRCINDMRFNNSTWLGLEVILRKIAVACSQWKILCVEGAKRRVEEITTSLGVAARSSPLMMWLEPGRGRSYGGITLWRCSPEAMEEWGERWRWLDSSYSLPLFPSLLNKL